MLRLFGKLKREKPINVLFFFGFRVLYRKNIYFMPSLLKTGFKGAYNCYNTIYLRSICIAENSDIYINLTAFYLHSKLLRENYQLKTILCKLT